MAAPTPVTTPDPPAPDGGLDAAVRVRRGDLVLDAALTARPGQVVAVLGPNGAGKTTLLRALAGLVPLVAGRVVVGGQVLDDVDAGVRVPAYRRGVGLLPQDHLLLPHLDARDNVAFGPRAQGLPRRRAREVADRWLAAVGAAHLAAARPRALSGGQAQRVALARALAVRPALLLLDEPTAALDALARLEVRSLLREHLPRADGTGVLVTHDVLDALALADHLVVLETGRVVQEGPPAAVVAAPRTPFVAGLVGLNLWEATVHGVRVRLDGGGELVTAVAPARPGPVLVTVRPGAVRVARAPVGTADDAGTGPADGWPARLVGLEHQGQAVRLRLQPTGRAGAALLADVEPDRVAALSVGAPELWVQVPPQEVVLQPR
ncbi:ABC transporter ATP-binding protein [Cellulomonas marina]|uniref:Molybdate transport system ATP-binding protein n=1 Tax=Cellulomonas marina TaxID=988821 RepID=A0A1I1ACV8_9CELL|nr:ABC transporter ATP-binding protein [Cellulomonas marina]GIG29729.1 ABC transporter ATP-binding protein [Cellulomonas marina]SFB35817.1 molybdate transport system ATP-binding protein [Cellulomonas marina]